MSRIKQILLFILIIFIAIQFIQPAHNKNGQVLQTDFEKTFVVPDHVKSVLQNTCYDCHSNDTKYPWYSHIQPFAWMMADHIRSGKEKLNFSEFGSYSGRRQVSKLKEMANQIKDGEMPIVSYKMMHKVARLPEAEKMKIIDWINKTADSLSANQ